MCLGKENKNIAWGGGKTSVKSKGYNTLLVILILFLGLISSSFLVKAENEVFVGPVCGEVPVLCEKAKIEFLKNEGFVKNNKGCALLDCNCDNIVYADALNLIINSCYKKLEIYNKENK
ncbi:MAG: hypothetical protein ACI4N3_03940 [Alphaproteobacteria bacterium]